MKFTVNLDKGHEKRIGDILENSRFKNNRRNKLVLVNEILELVISDYIRNTESFGMNLRNILHESGDNFNLEKDYSDEELIQTIKEHIRGVYSKVKGFSVDIGGLAYLLVKLDELSNELHMSDILGRDLLDDYICDEIEKHVNNYPLTVEKEESLKKYLKD